MAVVFMHIKIEFFKEGKREGLNKKEEMNLQMKSLKT